MKVQPLCLLVTCAATGAPGLAQVGPAAAAPHAAFERIQLDAEYRTESCCLVDVDRDGDLDVVAGPYWYESPEFVERHVLRPAATFPVTAYADEFLTFGEDVDRDGWGDVVAVGFPGKDAVWYRNPRGARGPWRRHAALDGVGTEAPALVDLDGDGGRELVCSRQGALGYATTSAAGPWTFRSITPAVGWPIFSHGLGAGDVNGDGRNDVLTHLGWLEQPPSLAGDPPWASHVVAFGSGGAQMFAFDADGDGDADVATSIAAHGYGLSWFEQRPTPDASTVWKEHRILPPDPLPAGAAGVQFSQLHAVERTDLDGDGAWDLVSGKTWLAHNGNDPGADEPAVLYAFLHRERADGVEFVPLLLDDDSGVGRRFEAGDLNGDGLVDVAVANKKGAHVFLQAGGR